MSTFRFKNILGVERDSKDTCCVNTLKESYNYWFSQRSAFEFESPKDQILIFFPPSEQDYDETLYELKDSYQPIKDINCIQGIIKILCDGLNVKVVDCKLFKTEKEFRKNIITFREYI